MYECQGMVGIAGTYQKEDLSGFKSSLADERTRRFIPVLAGSFAPVFPRSEP